ncbi:sugar ABC transporter permease [Antribacter sp. KLBMP9083]|uniref:Sugar ABC transporter permease n=2 Tax=Antribacter soli TaxID=2910976 RepID=A0AA41QFQ9_9MICO|nr:sugar ABC transporter permease [Antribacter soli]MCF4122273.1 sugar ABC transporter permease [Antribacter soli]
MLVILGLFLVLPIFMALWVSLSDWTGRGSPFAATTNYVGGENYAELLTGGGLAERDFGTSIRNNLYYVLIVVPVQTIISLLLAVLVNQRLLKARGFFRTAFYFPSVTSSVAITVVFLFLFSASGAVNRAVAYLGVNGPNWINDPRGLLHIILGAFGVDSPPGALQEAPFLGVSWWNWLAGPSVTMTIYIIMAIFTTSGTFMLLYLAALQGISGDIQEATLVDGANAWQRLWLVTVPMLRPTTFTVITLGLIGTWQVFDQIYTGTRGSPSKTTLTPAYLSYETSFNSQQWGQGAAIAFILFAIIVVLTILQRIVLRESDVVPKRKRFRPTGEGGRSSVVPVGPPVVPVKPPAGGAA